MKFTPIAPPPALARFVRSFWTVHSEADAEADRSFNTMADGLPGLMVNLPGGSLLKDSDHGVMPPAFIYGQATRWRQLRAQGDLRALGVFFQPHALRTVFGLDAPVHTDACLDLGSKVVPNGGAIAAAIAKEENTDRCVAAITAFIAERIRANEVQHDKVIIRAVEAIIEAHGDIPLEELLDDTALTERTFERRFKQNVGLTPRLLARIRRFQRTLQMMRSGTYGKLSDIAYAADYADQSHYIRSFKEFTGLSPLEFTRDGDEVIENFVELPPDP